MKNDILINLLNILPNGKTTLPVELIIDKMGSSTVLNMRIKLNAKPLTTPPDSVNIKDRN